MGQVSGGEGRPQGAAAQPQPARRRRAETAYGGLPCGRFSGKAPFSPSGHLLPTAASGKMRRGCWGKIIADNYFYPKEVQKEWIT